MILFLDEKSVCRYVWAGSVNLFFCMKKLNVFINSEFQHSLHFLRNTHKESVSVGTHHVTNPSVRFPPPPFHFELVSILIFSPADEGSMNIRNFWLLHLQHSHGTVSNCIISFFAIPSERDLLSNFGAIDTSVLGVTGQ